MAATSTEASGGRNKVGKRKATLLVLALLVPALGIAGYFVLRRPAKDRMERYIPGTCLAFLEIDDLGGLLQGLTSTTAWRQLAPAFGISSQLKEAGFAADLMGRTGLGPEEAVVAGRGQYALVLTGVDVDSGSTGDGPYIHFHPHFTLIIETHSKPEVAAHLVSDRAGLLADRIYGMSARVEDVRYFEGSLKVFHGPEPGHQLVAAASSGFVLIGNDTGSVESCLDTLTGRTGSMAGDATLKRFRPEVDQGSQVFAYITAAGVAKLAEIGPAVIASRLTADPEQIGAVASLVEHLSDQVISGFLYSAGFESGEVVDRYLTVLSPPVAGELRDVIEPASDRTGLGTLRLVPSSAEDFMIFAIRNAGDLPERGLRNLAPRLDLAAGIALREVVAGYRKRIGLTGEDSLSDAVGDEVTLVRFDESQPMVVIMAVREQARLIPYLARYLGFGGSTITGLDYKGVTVETSSNKDGRAASFVGGYLVLGTQQEIEKVIDAFNGNGSEANDSRVVDSLGRHSGTAPITSCRIAAEGAVETMLTISKLTRTTDGSPELLKQDQVREAAGKLPASISITEFRDSGPYTETRSAVGNFSLMAPATGGD
ncbi:MAG TPA: hypothetical protein VJX67_22725 [Blastocatellia bacterium]|nr:hypothetical protein [Blastocatellia bacterium]